ncbi:2-dehydropantoate 2-reductase [Paenibacillus sp. SYP-B3998]|uniref:2-dehydropantoate 2-reductase n=1 Tax=Paenibacillus sp. SYP-B3998 TaxID=2678564 RepID=A0A6G3ZT07_9BACL|nr:2-dehydropantoate 2-reductase [Paenibacillus sp. SYP-B3998]NEW05255.1 2-dehydropantoate 2-reductase [Paenibacillus sp. SYP-B3998]
MRIMIVGAGSLGLLFAAKLSAVCEQIIVVTRTIEQAVTLKERGIFVLDETTTERNKSMGLDIQYNSYIEDSRNPMFDMQANEVCLDYVFLMVKQPAITSEMITYVKSRMSSTTVLICIQNGVGHEERLSEAIGKNRLLLAVTTEGARKERANEVFHTGQGVTYMGSLTQNDGPAWSTQILLRDLLKEAGFETIMSKDMKVRIWSKLIMNAVINPLTAILRVRNGELVNSPWAQLLMRQLYEEALLVAKAKDVELPAELWETLLQVCRATEQNHSSMLQDLMQARGTEIDSMNGSLLRMAEELKLELAVNKIVYHFVKALE